MRFKLIENISKKVGGNENLLIILLGCLILMLLVVFYAIGYRGNTLENMCFYEYPKDYVCSCTSNANKMIDLDNLFLNKT